MPDRPSRPLHITLHSWQQTVIDSRWNYQLKAHFWRLYRNHDTGVHLQGPDGTVSMQANKLYLIPSLCDLQGSCTGPVAHDFCHFSLGWPFHKVEGWTRQAIAIDPNLPCADLLDRGLAEGPFGHLQIQACILLAVGDAVAALPATDRQQLADLQQREDAVYQVCAHIDANLDQDLSTAGLARLTGWSPDHFARRFKASTGRSPHAFVRERRCSQAAEMLLREDSDINEIAQAVGFRNRYHFSQVFKAVMRVPPATFRRQGRI